MGGMTDYKTTFGFVLVMLVAFIAGWFAMLALLGSRW
jgi:hypothetical protein